jgi:hypothetical protein
MISRTSTVIGYFDILGQFNFSIDIGRLAKSSYFEYGQDQVWPLGIQMAIGGLLAISLTVATTLSVWQSAER